MGTTQSAAPDQWSRAVERLRLPAQGRAALAERVAVGGDAGDRDDRRPVLGDEPLQPLAALAQLLAGELGGARGGPPHEVGDPDAPRHEVRAIGIGHPGDPIDLVIGDAGRGQRRIEAIGGMREVGFDRGRPQARVDADEQQPEPRPHEIVDLAAPERLQLQTREPHARDPARSVDFARPRSSSWVEGLRGSSRDRRRIEMGKLIATTQATVDGVIDPVGEWVQAGGDHGDYSFERQARSSGLVLGRKTYEGLAGYWPSQSGKWADMVNSMPKYVGSNTLSGDLEWNATLLEGDLEDSIPKLKDEVDGDLFMHGSGEFAYALAEKGLIDEYEVYLNPLVWGEGNVHVLGDRGTVRMELDDVKRFDSGVVLLTYLPAS